MTGRGCQEVVSSLTARNKAKYHRCVVYLSPKCCIFSYPKGVRSTILLKAPSTLTFSLSRAVGRPGHFFLAVSTELAPRLAPIPKTKLKVSRDSYCPWTSQLDHGDLMFFTSARIIYRNKCHVGISTQCTLIIMAIKFVFLSVLPTLEMSQLLCGTPSSRWYIRFFPRHNLARLWD